MEPKPVERGLGAAYRLGYADGVDYERRQTWKWLIFVAVISFLAGAAIF